MANEASVSSSLRLVKGNLQYASSPTGFTADVTGEGGPTPGAILVSTDGTDVDLSELAVPGLCRIMNLDETNYVTVGVWDDPDFHEFLELLPGESFVMRLSREFGSGGTYEGNTLRIAADTAACRVLVEVFEA